MTDSQATDKEGQQRIVDIGTLEGAQEECRYLLTENERLKRELAALRLLEGMDALEVSALGMFLKGGDIPATIDAARGVLVRRMLEAEKAVSSSGTAQAQGTFACSVCGKDTPHWHDIDVVNRERVIERVVRPAFEQAYTELARAFPDIRVSGWVGGFQRRQEKDAPDPVAHPSIILGWYDRWPDDAPAPRKGEYKNPVIQSLWRLWLRAGSKSSRPQRRQEPHDWQPDGGTLRFESHPNGEAPHVHTTCATCGARAWFLEFQWELLTKGCADAK